MALEVTQGQVKDTFVAASDLSAKKGFFVVLDSTGKVDVVTGTSDRPIGVLQNNPKAGQEAEVVLSGITKMVASAALAVRDSLATSANGRAATAATTTGLANLGTVLSANTAAGGWVKVSVHCLNQTR